MEFLLKNIKFACKDVEATQEFYSQCLQMSLERLHDIGSKLQFVFRFPNSEVGLLFEYERSLVQQRRIAMSQQQHGPSSPSPSSHNHNNSNHVNKIPPMTSDAQLLIYVNSLSSVMETVIKRGFFVRLDMREVQPGLRSAVVIDPNGIRITLIEADSCRANKPASGRVGYVTWPVRDFASIDRTCAFWDCLSAKPSLAQKHRQQQSQQQANNPWHDAYNSVREMDRIHDERVGFRVVDAEKFVEDLTSYCWLANGLRTVHSSVCYKHRGDKRSAALPTANITNSNGSSQFQGNMNHLNSMSMASSSISGDKDGEKSKVFLGVQIFVFDLPRALSRLQEQTIVDLSPTPDGDPEKRKDKESSSSASSIDESIPTDTEAEKGSDHNSEKNSHLQHKDSSSILPLPLVEVPGLPRYFAGIDPSGLPFEVTDGSVCALPGDIKKQAGQALASKNRIHQLKTHSNLQQVDSMSTLPMSASSSQALIDATGTTTMLMDAKEFFDADDEDWGDDGSLF